MIQVRLLDPTEYDKLPIKLDPANSLAVILEDDETKELKGYWVAKDVVHAEPVWLAEDQRGTRNGIKLYAALLAVLASRDVPAFYCFSDKDENDDYLARLGLALQPYTTFLGEVPALPISQDAAQRQE